jgi:carbamoyl-phosphate synthase large subunit
MGFKIVATEGTAKALLEAGIGADVVHKLVEHQSPNVLDLMKEGCISWSSTRPAASWRAADEIKIRMEAISRGIPIVTTEDGAHATVDAIQYVQKNDWTVRAARPGA